jgi:predicted RNase H-like HicB family nuclease
MGMDEGYQNRAFHETLRQTLTVLISSRWKCTLAIMRQVIIYPDPEDGGFVAEVPSLPGCVSQGETRDEALRNVAEAIKLWLESAASLHMSIPSDPKQVEICEV